MNRITYYFILLILILPWHVLADNQILESDIKICETDDDCVIVPYAHCCGSSKQAINRKFREIYEETAEWQVYDDPMCAMIGQCQDDTDFNQAYCADGLEHKICAITAGVSPAVGNSLDRAELERRADALFAEAGVDENTPGCAVGVIEDGQWALQKSYGLANLEYGMPITSRSIFRTGSVSKQFTATAIALLAQEGRIDLDADIHTYLPDLIDYGHKVTIRQMIHHVSGIPDYEAGLPALKTAKGKDLRLHNQDYLSIPEFYDRAKSIPLFAPPETEFAYSNTAYFLLSQIVEAASGTSLRAYANENIFSPLGMHETFFNDEVNDVVKNRAGGYIRKEDGSYSIYMTNLSWVGDGGVYTNLDDFLKWDQNFYHNILGDKEFDLVHQMEQTHDVSGDYAWGQGVRIHDGLKQISHTGSWVGFTSYYSRYPELRTSIVTFCNSNVIEAKVGKKIEERILEQLAGKKGF